MPDAGVEQVLAEIDNAKRELGIVSDAELAAHIGYQRSSIAQWKKRGSIPGSAKHVLAQTVAARAAGLKAKRLVDRMPASERQLCRAIALRYLIVSTEEGDLVPDEMLYRALVMDELEVAASLLLRHVMANGAPELIVAYRKVCASSTFETDLTEFLRPPADAPER